jgi:Fe-S-cluster containining protein
MAKKVTIKARVAIGGKPVDLKMTVPAGPVAPGELLPLYRAVAERVVSSGVEKAGGRVSCRKGCGACCRQLVPISRLEARHLAALVEAMPEPRRSEVLGRFDRIVEVTREAGLLDELRAVGREPMDVAALALRYFRLGLPCPFLEAESCSIHPERPVACREYLVQSDPADCAEPDSGRVQGIPMPGKVSRVLERLEGGVPEGLSPSLPMPLALEWAAEHPEPDPECVRPGPDLLQTFFARLARLS